MPPPPSSSGQSRLAQSALNSLTSPYWPESGGRGLSGGPDQVLGAEGHGANALTPARWYAAIPPSVARPGSARSRITAPTASKPTSSDRISSAVAALRKGGRMTIVAMAAMRQGPRRSSPRRVRRPAASTDPRPGARPAWHSWGYPGCEAFQVPTDRGQAR